MECDMANKHVGSDFDDFLLEEAILEEASATAIKRVIAWQSEQENESAAHHKSCDGCQNEN